MCRTFDRCRKFNDCSVPVLIQDKKLSHVISKNQLQSKMLAVLPPSPPPVLLLFGSKASRRHLSPLYRSSLSAARGSKSIWSTTAVTASREMVLRHTT